MADQGVLAEVSIDLSIEELVVLSEALGGPLPASVRPGDTTVDVAGRQLVTRALVARRLLSTEPTTELHVSVRRLLELVVAPALYAEVSRRTVSGSAAWSVTAVPEAAVEQYEVWPGIYRFTPFPVPEVPVRLIERAGVVERPGHGPVETFTVTAADLVGAAQAMEAGDRGAARARLGAGGVADELAGSFVDAAMNRVATASVTVVHRTSATTVEGGRLCWLDGGDEGGLWLVPEPETLDNPDADQTVEVTRTSRQGLLAELAALLPA